MTETGVIGVISIVANLTFSYKGFINDLFFERYKFEVDSILINKEYKRLITSGFLHVGWVHLIFNMLSLYAFSSLVETNLGGLKVLMIYLISLVGGNLLSLFVHRNYGSFSSVGASGAVCGIVFASIALFPGLGIGFFGIPLSIPSWLYGIIYILYTIYGIRSGKDNVGHEAHLGGALIGMAVALILEPAAFVENYLVILIIAVPAAAFIYLIITRPQILLVDNSYVKTRKSYYSVDQRYNEEKKNDQEGIDKILDKISKKGIDSLSKNEKQKLKQYSQVVR